MKAIKYLKYLIVYGSILSTLNCKYDEIAPLIADFKVQSTSLKALVPIQFEDFSIGAKTWDWNFGNGQTYSGNKPPQQFFPSKGSYTVSLTVTNGTGGTDKKTISIPIGSCTLPVANFTTSGILKAAKKINFINKSTLNADSSITSYLWNFGNGNTSTLQNPSFVFTNAGTYTVTLTTITPCGSHLVSKTLPIQSIYPTMITIPSANLTFTMGCTDPGNNCSSDEKPIHNVSLSQYEISETEITQAQWDSVMNPVGISNPSFFSNCSECPVEQVSWLDAMVFCNRLSELKGLTPTYYSDLNFTVIYGKNGNTWSLPNTWPQFIKQNTNGYRLPTEAEWEHAARGGVNNQIYSGSDDIDAVSWYVSTSAGRTNPVKTGVAHNQFGLYDMSGNVWEWCQDYYGAYSSSNQTNPTGPTSGSDPIIRGGSWDYNKYASRVARRLFYERQKRNHNIGFRIVRPL